MNWVVIILRFLFGLRQSDEELQPIAVRPDGTTCHPESDEDQWLPVSCWSWLKLRTRWLGLVRIVDPLLEFKLHTRPRHRSRVDRQRSSLE